MNEVKIPNHVGIIVDGNGRWATQRGLPRSKGHEAGFKNIQQLTSYIYKKGVKYISAYLFSTENFKRSKEEVGYIMNTLLVGSLKEILSFCKKEKIRAIISGKKENLSEKVLNAIDKIEEETKQYDKKVFNICFNYGGRAEIVDACKKIVKDVNDGIINIDDLTEEEFGRYLYQQIPPIDLLIRTSGEMRISNFMLWQNAYSEFYFPNTLFPDFKEKDFDIALEEYTKRDRRFGGVNYENKNN
ncbi:MAG: di-trans,poly-cis-decaprenylcistransferase [Bacilli bacterium]|nr:di-trans,poly-cis-decaprenylcistransferase [Bacilli bacterium]